MSNSENLNENLSRQDADEAALLGNEMDHEVSTTPTAAAQASLQNMAQGENEKFEKELTTCSQLLDQVRRVFWFLIGLRNLKRALQSSNHAPCKKTRRNLRQHACNGKIPHFLSYPPLFCLFSFFYHFSMTVEKPHLNNHRSEGSYPAIHKRRA